MVQSLPVSRAKAHRYDKSVSGGAKTVYFWRLQNHLS
jgi:hypothetical protein